MNIILTGPTGTAGSDVLRQCLQDPQVGKVLALSRRPLTVEHPKLKVLTLDDFLDLSKVLPSLKGYRACLWCLGISQKQVGPEEYYRITYDYTVAGAKAMSSVNPGFTFCFLSGQGADPTEKSPFLFARVKGRAETALDHIGLPHVYHFRPGYIHSKNQPKDKRKFEDRLLSPLAPLFYRFTPGLIINTEDLGKAMLQVAQHGSNLRVLENRDIKRIADSRKT